MHHLQLLTLLVVLSSHRGAFAQTEISVFDFAAEEDQQQDEGLLKYTRALEAFRQSPDNWAGFKSRNGKENVDIVTTTSFTTDSLLTQDLEGKAICHILEMNRYSFPVGPGALLTFPSTYPLESLAAVVMATEHLNTGDGSVVTELDGLNERCNIRFTSEFLDTQGQEVEAVDHVINAIQRESPQQQSPCAFLGGFRAQVNIATALYTSLKGYPQVSTLTSAPQLDNKDIYPLYGSLNPSNLAKPFL